MMERASLNGYQSRRQTWRSEKIAAQGQRGLHRSKKIKWRFKPRALGSLITLGLLLFCAGRLVVVPLIEGVCHYSSKTRELAELQRRSQILQKRLIALEKTRTYMETDAYVEEKGHQIGMIKQNESQMVVVDSDVLKQKENQGKKAKEANYQD
jgi:hypothetical protein